MLDELERGALEELRLELAALLSERIAQMESRSSEAVGRWCTLLGSVRSAGGFTGAINAEAAAEEDEAVAQSREMLFANLRQLLKAHSIA